VQVEEREGCVEFFEQECREGAWLNCVECKV